MANTKAIGWEKKRIHERTAFSRSGLIGRNYEVSNAYIVEVHKNSNGSGDDVFGGAKEWPVVTAHIGFTEGSEQQAADFADKLRRCIDQHIPDTQEAK